HSAQWVSTEYTGAAKRSSSAFPGSRGEERDMKLTRNRVIGVALVVLVAVLGIGQHLLEKEAIAQTNGKVMVPKFEVDPFWPKPMPNNWVFGQTIGLGIDEKDQVWIIHRGNDPGNLDRTEYAYPPPGGGPGGGGAPAGAAPAGPAPPRRGSAVSKYPPRERVLPAGAAGGGVRSGRQRGLQLGRSVAPS